jgi:hypothetical protein
MRPDPRAEPEELPVERSTLTPTGDEDLRASLAALQARAEMNQAASRAFLEKGEHILENLNEHAARSDKRSRAMAREVASIRASLATNAVEVGKNTSQLLVLEGWIKRIDARLARVETDEVTVPGTPNARAAMFASDPALAAEHARLEERVRALTSEATEAKRLAAAAAAAAEGAADRTDQHKLEATKAQLEKLEERNRYYTRAAVGVALAVLAAVLGAYLLGKGSIPHERSPSVRSTGSDPALSPGR